MLISVCVKSCNMQLIFETTYFKNEKKNHILKPKSFFLFRSSYNRKNLFQASYIRNMQGKRTHYVSADWPPGVAGNSSCKKLHNWYILQQNTQNIFSNMKMALPFWLNAVWKNPEGGPKAKLMGPLHQASPLAHCIKYHSNHFKNAILLVILISTRVAPLGSSRVSNEAKN